jgi:predicted RNase H-like HicB family nuclease
MKPNNIKRGKRLKSISFEQYIRLALSHAEFSQNEDDSWTVDIPVLPGCVTWGATRGEAVEMAKDAAEAWILTALRFGDEVPSIDGNSLQYAIDKLGAKV